ncbi:hypothetical protein RB623_14210 [Mesorhizobium sp. LHD-90]|uniref:hypothetical protein n=1 Tax=Mesorhizobium sp. LHD-90 TaxID=3071414 RepID=UPI0027DEB4E5|nr:hypothetical protein [Mesorhizobium sp. LHD-90]MDQ6435207.1 hypothetical protein [Mesorhizobium sp. LHD-90]
MKRVILDEGVPKTLAGKLRALGLDASAFPNGWKQLSNGNLLNEIEKQGFEVLVTNDKRMQFQQNLRGKRIAIVVLPTNTRIDVLKLVPMIADAIRAVSAGTFFHIGASSSTPEKKS